MNRYTTPRELDEGFGIDDFDRMEEVNKKYKKEKDEVDD